MSLNNVHLTPQLLADLYGRVLVQDVPETEAAAPTPEAPPAHTLGQNVRHILIITTGNGQPVTAEEQVFLTTILAACKLTLADVLVLNWDELTDKQYKTLLQVYDSKTVLLFNLQPAQFGLPLQFPPFQLQAFDGRTYLHAPALAAIQSNKTLKLELWNSLKKLFVL